MTDLKFTHTHEWLQPTQNEEATIGITDHAQQLLGDMVFVELPKVGDVIAAGDEIGVVESVKAASDFYAPASGTVVAVNDQVCNQPGIVNDDPLGNGWLVKIKLSNPAELTQLLTQEQYNHEISEGH